MMEYATDVLSLGFLLLKFNDANRESNSDHIVRCWQFFLLIFKATTRKKLCDLKPSYYLHS